MSRSNLEIQDQLRGALMAKLLEGGVIRQNLSSEDFEQPFEAEFHGMNSFDSLFMDMLIWLQQEGFIRHEGFHTGSNGEACVTLCSPTATAMKQLDEKVPGPGPVTVREIVTTSSGPSYESYGRLGAFFGGLIGGYQGSVG
ncbi:hypothetical protein EN801_020450 [Mesorhizobium sp. M00.F.Ca.ET.158.01.1.1]|nr:hypothetical protein EN801_020450 [Mesorhizobium sp. M00.F.Ca.ET.158.01.1.1]